MAEKARYWVAIMYPENMIDDWQSEIASKLQIPFAYCIHDKCMEKDGKTVRKEHVHIMVAFSNTTTQNHALTVFKTLEKPGCSAIPNDVIQQVFGVRNQYDYLIHDTEDCRKKNKYQYSAQERVTGNNFDIGSYEQLSLDDKEKILDEIADVVFEKQFCNFGDLYMYIRDNYDKEYKHQLRANNGFFERLTKSNYQKKHDKIYKDS